MSLWVSWVMMNRLHCTYTELQQQPLEEMLIFESFAVGEAAAEKAVRDQRDAANK